MQVLIVPGICAHLLYSAWVLSQPARLPGAALYRWYNVLLFWLLRPLGWFLGARARSREGGRRPIGAICYGLACTFAYGMMFSVLAHSAVSGLQPGIEEQPYWARALASAGMLIIVWLSFPLGISAGWYRARVELLAKASGMR